MQNALEFSSISHNPSSIKNINYLSRTAYIDLSSLVFYLDSFIYFKNQKFFSCSIDTIPSIEMNSPDQIIIERRKLNRNISLAKYFLFS